MVDLDTVLATLEDSGVRQIGADVRDVVNAAERLQLKVWRVDIASANGKKDMLDALATAMSFPGHFGANWDALVDCLRDLSWAGTPRGYVIVIEKCQRFHADHREIFDIATDCLAEASAFWLDQGRPFWVLLSGPAGWDSGFASIGN